MKFYNKQGDEIETQLSEIITDEWMSRVLIPVIDKSSCISIRLIDWLCTNYSKEKSISYLWEDKERGKSHIFSIHSEYKQALKNKSRKLFDAFRRGERMYFSVAGEKYETTMGQLLFFRWADRYNVLSFLKQNIQAVEQHMADRQEAGKKRRKITKVRAALSSEPTSSCMVFPSKCTFHFDSDNE